MLQATEVLGAGGVRWTVEETLAVDCAPLLELLFHLVGDHLLAMAHLSELQRAVVVVFVADDSLFV